MNTRVFDVVMTHKLDADDLFIHRFQQLCAEARLNFFLIEPLWAEAFFAAFQQDRVWPRVLINLQSEHHQPAEIYHRLVQAAADRGVWVIDPPHLARAAFDKSQLHARLIGAGLPAPYTVVVRADQLGGFKLSAEQREALGSPFVIKPALGYGKRGVVLDATTEADVARSIVGWNDEVYLLQRRIVPRELAGQPAYFRVFYVFGSIWSCWWNCNNDRYRSVSESEHAEFALAPLEDIIRRLATLTGMMFFSTEIAQTAAGEFVLIDYVNDQCHMLSQSANPQIGVPNEVILGIAARLVEAVRGHLATAQLRSLA